VKNSVITLQYGTASETYYRSRILLSHYSSCACLALQSSCLTYDRLSQPQVDYTGGENDAKI